MHKMRLTYSNYDLLADGKRGILIERKKQGRETSAFGRLMEYAGRFRVLTYLIQMPGLQEWSESIGLTVKTGDILRVRLSETR